MLLSGKLAFPSILCCAQIQFRHFHIDVLGSWKTKNQCWVLVKEQNLHVWLSRVNILGPWPPKLVVKDKCYSNSWSGYRPKIFNHECENPVAFPQGPRPYCCCNNSQRITATKTKYVILRLQPQPRPLLQVALQLLRGGKAPVICSVLWYQQWLHAHIQW